MLDSFLGLSDEISVLPNLTQVSSVFRIDDFPCFWWLVDDFATQVGEGNFVAGDPVQNLPYVRLLAFDRRQKRLQQTKPWF